MKILLVDDDPDLLAVTTFALQQAGFLVVRAVDGPSALALFERERPELAVLDINLPRMNGFELARRIRQQSAIPLIMLTVRSEEEDVVRALELGADDYLTKPFSPRILVARVRALLRRAGIESEGTVTLGLLTLQVDDLALETASGERIRLTPLETRLLQLLFTNAGRTVATDRILPHVWGNRGGGNRHLLKQLVHRLRHKLEADPANPGILRTVPNAGYLLDPAGIPSGLTGHTSPAGQTTGRAT
jgi:DNA-binding response OmpR family regulator